MVFKPGFAAGTEPADGHLIARMARSFALVHATHRADEGSFWNTIEGDKKNIAQWLLSGELDKAAAFLQNPAGSMFFYGFEHLVSEFSDALKSGGDAAEQGQGADYQHRLHLLALALGLGRVPNPEAAATFPVPTTDELIEKIERHIGQNIRFPNPFPNEFGILSTRGVVSYRAVQSLYQALLLKDMASVFPSPSVVDIGGGLGRTAFYAHSLGFRDYTLIDLPTTGLAQAYFLGRTLGERAVSLFGEPLSEVNVRIPEWLISSRDVDVVINVDSFTEMSRQSAEQYVAWAAKHAKMLISINHEANHFTAREVMLAAGLNPSREKYWLRDGYVVEVARIRDC